ncbi:MAG: DEAD/DEAH box helicase [Candidatus Lokiarchaeota archaeon]
MIVKTEPYKHQYDAYAYLYDKEYGALFMEQGTGKSKVAIDIAYNRFLENKINAVMLIAPNGVHTQWAEEQIPIHSNNYNIKVWGKKKNKLYKRVLEEFVNEPERLKRLKWFCINVEAFSTLNNINIFLEYLFNNNVMIIIDECTRIKNIKANRTFNICYNLAKRKLGGRNGNKVLKIIPLSAYRLILTGTMITNSPYDLWSMFEFLKFRYFGCDYFSFKNRYGISIIDSNVQYERDFTRSIRKDEIQSVLTYYKEKNYTIENIAALMRIQESNVKYIIEHPDVNIPYKHLDELKRRIKPVSFIIRKKDCLDLPPKVYEQSYVEMNTEQKRIYKDLKNRYLAEYADKELSVVNKISLYIRFQQITGGFFPYYEDKYKKYKTIPISNNPKLKRLKEDIEETDEILIIWARFTAEIILLWKELQKAFPDKYIATYYGKTSDNERNRIINEFKQNKINIIILNQSVGAFGLNLQNSSFQYFYSNTYSLEHRDQSEDRSHRIGTKKSVLYKDIIMRNSIDEKIYKLLKERKNLLDYFRDTSIEEFLG